MLVQIIADTWQVPVSVLSEPDAAARGGAIQAALAGEQPSEPYAFVISHAQQDGHVFEPNTQLKEAYQEAFNRYVQTADKLFANEQV